jgi:glycosyltransferase involved in cell wall biosynthesis
MLHNRYLIGGGEDQSTIAEITLLRDRGCTVDYFEVNNENIKALGKTKTAIQAIWSHSSYEEVQKRLTMFKYDILHVQNFFPLLSPSVYYAAQDNGVAVVQSLRNYRLLCPGALFFRDGKICEDCLNQPIPWPGILHGCYRESRGATSVVTAMLTAHRFLKTFETQVNAFIALTEFTREKYIQGGLPPDKIWVKPNFLFSDPGVGKGDGKFALFVGRLSPEKGLQKRYYCAL